MEWRKTNGPSSTAMPATADVMNCLPAYILVSITLDMTLDNLHIIA